MTVENIAPCPVEMGKRPTRSEAEEAVRILLFYYGEDLSREGLVDTPRRFIEAYHDFLSGYREDPVAILSSTFEEVNGYNDIVLMKDIRFESHCEHHIQPMIGVAHVAYLPSSRVVGISKLARVVDAYARRLQSQETLTSQIAQAIETALAPRGVAVLIDSTHQCIATRGVHKTETSCVTQMLIGAFRSDPQLETRFHRLISY